jgi:hypothetical protein
MDSKSEIIASWESGVNEFRVVALRPRARSPQFVIEKKHTDALGEASWRSYTLTSVTGGVESPFQELLEGLNTGKYELVKKW